MNAALCPCLLLAAVVAHGATEGEDWIDRSRGLPLEFAADSLLRIAADSKLVPSKADRIDLIEEAFRLAAHAQMPSPLRGRVFHTDTRPGWRNIAAETGLNSLDLQVRALEQMLHLDRGRVRQMFSEMRPIAVEAGSCKEPQRPSLMNYYRAMLLVAKNGFTAEEVAEGEPERWLAGNLRAMRTPAQLTGAMRAIAERSDAMLQAVAGALPYFVHDWTGFVYADGDLPMTVQTAVPVREYIVRSMRGARCGGRSSMRLEGEVPFPVATFNGFVKGHPELQLDPIEHEKLEPSRVEDGYELEEFWKSAKSKQVMAELKWLNHGNRDLPGDQRFWTLEERKAPAWNERYAALLKVMEGWKEDDEASPADYFHMRAHTLMSLTELTPPGAARTNAMRSLIEYLNGAYNGRVPHAEWFTHADHLIRRTKSDSWVLDELEQYGNIVLSHYARLAKRGLLQR